LHVIEPGELRHELTVEKNTPARQDDGTVDPSWVAQSPDPIRAKVEDLTGTEYVEAQALAAGAKVKVTMRYFSGLEPTLYRFSFGSRILEILHVNNVESRNVLMIVLCGEKLS
jgi:head-tail adaptor